jgi:Bifunctional DNA primase/polymerase, N-terminal
MSDLPTMDPDEACLIAQNVARNMGYPVFPCLENKRPATPHGFKDATNDKEGIARLWRQFPGPLIGIPTGKVSGFDVLDIDVKHDAARAWLIAAKDRIPSTSTYQTRSGGFHVLFRHVEGVHNTESHIAKGIDTRGEGGYIIFWFGAGFPCTDHSPIADWADWLLEALFYKPEPEPIPARTHAFRSNGGNVQNLVAATLRRLETAPEGSRHAALRAASCTLGGVLDAAGMSATTAARLLLDAVLQAGGARVDQRNALGTINWGLAKGAASPLAVGAR